MMTQFCFQGFAVGLLAAIPLGPMGMVCVQRTLVHGRVAGLVSASGLTVAAAFWCVVAARGLSATADLFAGRESIAMVGLGIFLMLAGLSGLLRGRRQMQLLPKSDGGTLAGHFLTCLIGVVLNPITFVTMTAALAVLGGAHKESGFGSMAWLATSVFVGGMTVWLGITQSVALMRDRLGENGGFRINQVLNGCILVLGIGYLIRPLWPQLAG